jgi:hypothetical protein
VIPREGLKQIGSVLRLSHAVFVILVFSTLIPAYAVDPFLYNSYEAQPLRYLKYNIHAQQGPVDAKASYANWTDPGKGHFIMPINTKVRTSPYSRGFVITDVDRKQEVYFEYNGKHMRMSQDDYIKLITSPDPLPLDGFSDVDKEGIRQGKAFPRMSKKGVMVALGYPCAIATSSPADNVWTYWRNRWKKIAVEFDEAGLVKEIKEIR